MQSEEVKVVTPEFLMLQVEKLLMLDALSEVERVEILQRILTILEEDT